MDNNDPLIGRQFGDYRIVALLGRGGMARVYRGYDANLERYAAVKVIDAQLASGVNEEEYRQRFQREARAIARLRHPNIVGIYQFSEVDSLYYMAMVYIEGRDLAQILKDRARMGQRLPIEQVMAITRDMAAALDYAHAGGVIHRDIKPSNIMVTDDGHAVLTDFGLALNVPEGSIGTTLGTAHYIAPEQALSSAKAVPQSDFYSLAVVLYQMLVGQVPFDDPSMATLVLKHLNEPPPKPSTLNPEIAPELEAVLMRALAKDPHDRYQNGLTLMRALERALGMEPPPSARRQKTVISSDATPLLVYVGDPRPPSVSRSAPTASTASLRPRSAAKPATSAARRWLPIVLLGLVAIALIAVAALLLTQTDGGEPTPTQPAIPAAAELTEEVSLTNTPTVAPTRTPSATRTRTPTQTLHPTVTASTARVKANMTDFPAAFGRCWL
jgi:serine/threonine-protein kinase